LTTPLERVLLLLKKVKRSGKGFTALCPAHDDRHASLHVAQGDDGRVLLNCFAGCSPGAIAAAVGLTMRDLFAETAQPGPPRRQSPAPFPVWIEADPAWKNIRHAARWLLVCLAADCWKVLDDAGSLGHAALSKEFCRRAGMARSAAFRNARLLADAGFIVKLSQGGRLKAGRLTLNMFGIPGRRGALGARAIPFDARGKIAPQEVGGNVSQPRTRTQRVTTKDTPLR
jgi:hypothetical protein